MGEEELYGLYEKQAEVESKISNGASKYAEKMIIRDVRKDPSLLDHPEITNARYEYYYEEGREKLRKRLKNNPNNLNKKGGIKTEGGGRMGRKKLIVHRRGYTRKGGIRVKPATFKIKDRGAPGRGKKVIKIRHPGRLTKVGYNVKASASSRRRALRKAVRRYGERSTIRMLHAQAVYRKRTDSVGKRFAADRTWVAKQYGTYKSRKTRSTRRRGRSRSKFLRGLVR